MKSISISLDSVEKIKEFVNIIKNLDGEFDLISGKYVVNAKSIMGILSLDLTKNIRLDINNDKIFDEVTEKLKSFTNNIQHA